MSRIFLEILNISITSGWLIMVVLVLRLVLRKAPKWVSCLLWGIVAIRLVMPFSVESVFSLIPSARPVPTRIETMAVPVVNTGIVPVDNVINPMITEQFTPDVSDSINPLQVVTYAASVIWIIGVLLLLVYAFLSFISLKRKVSASALIEENIYICDDIAGPFILGAFKPCIYIPSRIDSLSYNYILSHEKAHLRRGDHFWKPFGFMLLAVYWFNPLCWFAYIMLCRDIEFACDEKATREMDRNDRADYCETLLSCSVNHHMIAACPIAFGETGVKDRVKNVLNYKKPAFWIIIAATIVCVVVAVCFLTNPKSDENQIIEKMENQIVENSKDEISAYADLEEPSEDYSKFIKSWAEAFCNRDGKMIAGMSSDSVRDSFMERGLLIMEDDYCSFGYSSPWPMWENIEYGCRIVKQNDTNLSAEILYYAWTSEPHVSVWKETVSLEKIDGEFVVSQEELRNFDYIDSGFEFDEAYPVINKTPMDYTVNGMGEALASNSMLSSSTIYSDLQNPVKSAKILLNLLDNENKVKVEMMQDDSKADTRNLTIMFAEDGAERMISMVKLDDESGIWIPQDYGTDRKTDISDVMNRVLNEYNYEAVPWNNTIEWKETADVLVEMAADSTGRYKAYGIISQEYGSYGIVINDTLDGTDENINYFYAPWVYTGTSSGEPQFKWVEDKLFFTYPIESEDDGIMQMLCYVDCGYETAHVEISRFLEPDIENQIAGLVILEKKDGKVNCISKESNHVFAILDCIGISDDSSVEIDLSGLFYILDASKLIVRVKEVDEAANTAVTIGYLAFDFDAEYNMEKGEAEFTISNPGTYSSGGIKEKYLGGADGTAKGIINGDKVKVRKNPSEDSELIGYLDDGYVVDILSTAGDYYQIQCVVDGDMVYLGYVFRRDVK
ncbi:MAG: hypothetical protein KIG50_02600 [Lachnospiraceae bacterium]|nr:hypothetical protein [Lachnospiraceae bacterium]